MNGHGTEVASLKKGEWSCYRGGQFNGQRMVMLQKWSLYWRENGYVRDVSVLWRENGYFTEVLTLMDICIFIVFYGQSWCFVSGIQYILPLNLLISLFLFINVFLHTAKFLHTGEREDFMPAKIEQVCQSREGE